MRAGFEGRGEPMSRSGYSDDCGDWELIMWRGAVESAIRGKRGQAFLKEMIAAMDAMPVKRLLAHDLVSNGEVCAIGSVAVARGLDVSGVEGYEHEKLSKLMGIAPALVQEIEFVNDDDFGYDNDTPEKRFERVYQWVKEQIAAARKKERK